MKAYGPLPFTLIDRDTYMSSEELGNGKSITSGRQI